MLKERHRHGVAAAAATSRRRGPQQNSSRSSSTVAPPEVGIIPANRFFLLPLKKVTALVRPYTPCRDSSATSTKPCIIAKTTTTATATATKSAPPIQGQTLHSLRNQAHSKRLIVKHRHRHSLVAKSPLSTVSLQLHAVPEREPLLWNNNSTNLPTGVNNNTRSFKHHISTVVVVIDPAAATQHRSTSVFSLNEPSCREAQAPSTLAIQEVGGYSTAKKTKKQKPPSSVYNGANTDFLRYSHTKMAMKTRFQNSTSTEKDRLSSAVRSFGRNNRVSPSSFGHGVDESHPGTFLANFDTRGDSATPRFKSNKGNKSDKGIKSSKSRNRASKVGCSAVLLHKIQSSSPFLCSFTNEKDLPVVGPAALHLRRLPAKAPAANILAPEASEAPQAPQAPAVPAAAALVEVSSPGIRAGFGNQNFLDL